MFVYKQNYIIESLDETCPLNIKLIEEIMGKKQCIVI